MKAGKAIKNYFKLLHRPALASLDSFYEQYIDALEDIKKKISGYESDNAVIRETFIENDVNNALDKVDSTAQEYVKEINKKSSTVDDLIQRFDVTTGGLDLKVNEAKQDNKNTVEKLNKLDEHSKSELAGKPAHTIQHTSELVNKMKGWSKDGVILKKGIIQEIKDYYNDHDIAGAVAAKTKRDETLKELDNEPSKYAVKKAFEMYKDGNLSNGSYNKFIDTLRAKGVQYTVDHADEFGTNLGSVLSTVVEVKGTNIQVKGRNQMSRSLLRQGTKIARVAGHVGTAITLASGVLEFQDDVNNNGKTKGQAVAHSAASVGVTLAGGAAGYSLAGGIATAALASNPVGWAVAGGLAGGALVSYGFKKLYDNNVFGIQDGLDWTGEKIQKGWNWAMKQESKEINWAVNQVDNATNWASSRINDIQETSRVVGKQVHVRAEHIRNEAEETGRNIREGAQEVGKHIRERAEETGNRIREGVEDIGNTAENVGKAVRSSVAAINPFS